MLRVPISRAVRTLSGCRPPPRRNWPSAIPATAGMGVRARQRLNRDGREIRIGGGVVPVIAIRGSNHVRRRSDQRGGKSKGTIGMNAAQLSVRENGPRRHRGFILVVKFLGL